MAPNLRGILPLAMIRLWSRLHGAQLYRGFSLQHRKRKKEPWAMFIDFKSILYMAPNGSYCSWNKHCFLTSKKETVTIKNLILPWYKHHVTESFK